MTTQTEAQRLARLCERIDELDSVQLEELGHVVSAELRRLEAEAQALRGAVPAVPDAIEVTADNDAAYGYQDGWNACRKAMLAAAPQPAAQADPFTYVIQHLNSSPYALTKDECITKIKELRAIYQAQGEKQ
jgi:hypothetical protein